MRMWMVNPEILCQKHLGGEHVELHMMVGTLNKGHNISGYIQKNLCEPSSIYTRHELLEEEGQRRGLKYNSALPKMDFQEFHHDIDLSYKIDVESSLKELLRRCPECRARYKNRRD